MILKWLIIIIMAGVLAVMPKGYNIVAGELRIEQVQFTVYPAKVTYKPNVMRVGMVRITNESPIPQRYRVDSRKITIQPNDSQIVYIDLDKKHREIKVTEINDNNIKYELVSEWIPEGGEK